MVEFPGNEEKNEQKLDIFMNLMSNSSKNNKNAKGKVRKKSNTTGP